MTILPTGRVGSITVLSDSGYPRLAQAAVEAVREAEFNPALTAMGAPTSSTQVIPFEFQLR